MEGQREGKGRGNKRGRGWEGGSRGEGDGEGIPIGQDYIFTKKMLSRDMLDKWV